MKEAKYIIFSDKDNVAVLLEDAAAGDVLALPHGALRLLSDTPRGFKAALRSIAAGETIYKYGEPIGRARMDIKTGGRVHEDNIVSALSGEFEPEPWREPVSPAPQEVPSFMGYRRKNGRVGIRNELWIIPTVGCIDGLLRNIIKSYEAPKHITAVRVLEHPWGCSQLGGDLDNTRNVLTALAHNPNAAGVLVAAMGCENLQLDSMMEGLLDVANLRTLTLQQETDEEKAVLKALSELAENAEHERSICKGSELTFAIKCGGSDAFSSITANPLLGRVTDKFTSAGGAVLMGEIPEMFGAEKGILARCKTREVYDRLTEELRDFRDYFVSHGQPVCENPSPGNKAGGISTLEEKSLGAVSKSGHSIVTGVLRYGETWKEQGLNVVYSPGNDLVSCTALAAAGAVMILFTTGRGTPFGTVVPTMKIATNAQIAAKKPGWIDFDASHVITDGMERAASMLTAKMTETASGEKTKNEINNIADISIFKDGVIL